MINRPSVIFDVQGGEAVIIDLTTGRYFRLDAASTALWERFAATSSPQSVLETCSTAAELEPHLDGIITDLLERGLLRVAGQPDAEASLSPGQWRFDGFSLEEFTDLEDILGLDPIHEVDPEKGWPHAAPG